jgi:hypothetical protein
MYPSASSTASLPDAITAENFSSFYACLRDCIHEGTILKTLEVSTRCLNRDGDRFLKKTSTYDFSSSDLPEDNRALFAILQEEAQLNPVPGKIVELSKKPFDSLEVQLFLIAFRQEYLEDKKKPFLGLKEQLIVGLNRSNEIMFPPFVIREWVSLKVIYALQAHPHKELSIFFKGALSSQEVVDNLF